MTKSAATKLIEDSVYKEYLAQYCQQMKCSAVLNWMNVVYY